MRADYNRHHFVRDEEFEQSWEHIDGEARRAFIEYRTYALYKLTIMCMNDIWSFQALRMKSR
jgi:hypothetical protein